jgi:hypothetical protein
MPDTVRGRPWKPGQSGNPKGRPRKGRTLTDLIAARLDKERFAEALLEAAYGGDVPALKLVLAYIDGPPESEEIPEGARVIEVRYVRPRD